MTTITNKATIEERIEDLKKQINIQRGLRNGRFAYILWEDLEELRNLQREEQREQIEERLQREEEGQKIK